MKKYFLAIFLFASAMLVSQHVQHGTNYIGSHVVGTGGAFSTSGSGTIAATTAAALASNPTNCSAGNYPLGIDASGNVESCTAAGSGSFDYPLATEFHFWEEFTHSSSSTNTMGWSFGGGTGAYVAAESGRPGIFRRTTSTTINTTAYFSRGVANSLIVDPADTFNLTWVVRVNTTTNQTVRVGLNCGSISAAQPAAGMYFELSNAGNWYAVNRTGNVETGTNQDTTVASSTGWVKLSVRRSSTNIIFAVNGTDRITQSSNVPTVICNPWTMITNTAGEDKTMDHDVVVLKVTGLSR